MSHHRPQGADESDPSLHSKDTESMLPTAPSPPKSLPPIIPVSPRVVLLSLTFALCQIVQEIAGEALFSLDFHNRSAGETALMYSLAQQLGTVLVASGVLLYQQSAAGATGAGAASPPPWRWVFSLACLIFASTTLANWAVAYVYYPSKVVAKSAKLVPTMIVSVLMGNSPAGFARSDYLAAFLISAGAAGFALESGRRDALVALVPEQEDSLIATGLSRNAELIYEEEEGRLASRLAAWIGLTMLTCSALADALVPNVQQKVMKNGASAEGLALRVNVVGSTGVFLALLFSGGAGAWWDVWLLDPSSLFVMMVGGGCLGVAVLCYTLLIREAGSVVAVAVATLRKVVTVGLSYLVFPDEEKRFGWVHAASALAVVAGMALPSLMSQWKGRRAGGSVS